MWLTSTLRPWLRISLRANSLKLPLLEDVQNCHLRKSHKGKKRKRSKLRNWSLVWLTSDHSTIGMSRCTQILSMHILPLKVLKFLRLWPLLSQEPPAITQTCCCQKSTRRCSRSVTKTSPLLKWSSFKSLRRTPKSFTRRMNLSPNWLLSNYHSTMVRALTL